MTPSPQLHLSVSHPRLHRVTIPLLASIGVAALLAGCATSAISSDEPSAATINVTLHPTGDSGSWFDSAYAAGVGGLYSTAANVCDITPTSTLEYISGPNGATHVQARSLTTGEILWEQPNAMCGAQAIAHDVALISEGLGSNRSWVLADPTSGAAIERLPIAANVSLAHVVAHSDGLWITVEDNTLAAYADSSTAESSGGSRSSDAPAGTEMWRAELGDNAQATELSDGAIGVLSGLDQTLEIYDSKTGELRDERSDVKTGWATWASDGYVLKINESDPEYAFYDLDGTELGRTEGESQYRFVPQAGAGVLFSIDDHMDAGTVVGVSADGVPALYEGANRKNFTQLGKVSELPDSIISLLGVSTDGSLLLFKRSGGGIVVLDGTGAEVFEWTALENSSVRVESGHIVLEQGGNTTVLLPN